MTTQHIAQDEWQRYFMSHKNQDSLLLRNKIMTHIASCAECQAFYDRASALAQAAQAYSEALKQQPSAYGYEAVAALSFPMDAQSGEGVFSVAIDTEGGTAVFMEETIEYTGSAEQYAVNPEDDSHCLREDLDAFRLELTGTSLHIHVEDTLVNKVHAILRSDAQTTDMLFDGNHARAELAADDIHVIELIFAE